jgi:hypothetical protein
MFCVAHFVKFHFEKKRHHFPVPKVSINIEKSFETWNFWQISTICLDLYQEFVNFIIFLNQEFSICQDFLSLKSLKKSWKCQDISINLQKSWQISKS